MENLTTQFGGRPESLSACIDVPLSVYDLDEGHNESRGGVDYHYEIGDLLNLLEMGWGCGFFFFFEVVGYGVQLYWTCSQQQLDRLKPLDIS